MKNPIIFIILVSTALLVSFCNVFSQSSLSPNASGFGKYADQPVNPLNGTTAFGIPIYTLSEGTLTHNVSLSYHTAGIRADEISSPIGTGWNLNAGGVIVRTVRGGIEDDEPGVGYQNVQSTLVFGADREQDLFFFNFDGISGKFVIDKNGVVQLLNKADISILIQKSSTGVFEGFKVRTANGQKYYFGDHIEGNGDTREFSHQNGKIRTSSFLLNRIESFDKKHKIDFEYADSDYTSNLLGFWRVIKYLKNGNVKTHHLNTYSPSQGQPLPPLPIFMNDGLVISKITTSTTQIDFTHLDRLDLHKVLSPPFIFGAPTNPKYINKIEINNGSFCQSFDLMHSYFKDGSPESNPANGINSTTRRLKLDKVQKVSCNGSLQENPFEFEYYGTDFLPKIDTRAIDHWGYYNGATGNSSIGHGPPTTVSLAGGVSISQFNDNRDTDFLSCRNGSLKKVIYPTKGSLEYTYESNKGVDYSGNNVFVFSKETCDYPTQACCPSTISTIPSAEATLTITNERLQTGVLTFSSTKSEYCTDPFAIANGNAWAQVRVVDMLSNNIVHAVSINAGIAPDSHASSSFLLADIPGLIVGNQYKFIIQSLYGPGVMHFRYIPASAEQDVGGLRIKDVRVSDGIDANKDIIKSYEYINSATGGTSGIVTKKPIYGIALNPHTALFQGNAISQLHSAEGNHITYTEVKEDLNGNGFNKYFLDYEFVDQNITSFPSKPIQSRLRNGKLLKQQSFRIEGNNSILEAQSILDRNTNDQKSVVAGDNVIGMEVCLANGSNNCPTSSITTNYVNEISTYRIKKNTSMLDGVTNVTNYAYHSTDAVLSPIKTWTTNSDGKIHELRYKYTVDYDENSSVGWSLFNNFLIGIPYEIEKYVGGQFVDGSKTIFRTFADNGVISWTNQNDFARPWKTQRYERTWENGNGALSNGEWTDQMFYHRYNQYGLVEESQEAGGWPKTFYNYNTDKLLLNQAYNGHSTAYEYFFGSTLLKKSFAIDGTTTSCTYDALMRLKTKTDDDNSITTSYDYYYVPEGSSLINEKNYLETTTIFPTITGHSKLSELKDRVYFDGLGREIQKVGVKQSWTYQSQVSNKKDLFTSTEYDKYGRVKYQYKQRASANNDGSYTVPQSSWLRSENKYFASPLSRMSESIPPNWASTKYSYGANTSVDNVKSGGSTNVYGANLLYKSIIEDPDGRKGVSFRDKLGRNVLGRNSGTSNNASAFLDTYNVFDDKSRLIYVLPPGALSTSGAYGNLYYQYTYDGEDKLLTKKIPGADVVDFIYNDRDLNVGYQDGFLRKQGKWYTFDYDNFGREVKQGFHNSNNANSGYHPIHDWQIETIYGSNSYDKDKVKTVNTKILGTNEVLTSTNSYNSKGILTSQSGSNHINNTPTSITSSFLRDGALNVYYSNTDISAHGTKNIKTINSFDQQGRSHANYFRVDNAGPYQLLSNFIYNAEDEVSIKYQGYIRGPKRYAQRIDYTYLDNGLLSKVNSSNLQGTEQAWNNCNVPQLAVPSNSNNGNTQKDLFYLELFYDTAIPGIATTTQSNGNIAGVKWQVKGRSQGAYSYKYDDYNRLTDADFYDIDDNVISNSGRYDSSYSYDNRGNMTSIQRNGMTDALGCNSYGQIDNLSFSYQSNSNRLDNVNDISGHSEGFENGWGGNYNYDENGNLTWNSDRKLSITYNHLNLPTVIQNFGTGGGYLHFKYDAAGNLLQRKASYTASGNDPIETIDYVGGIEYINGKVEQIMHSEGYVQYTNGTNPEYHYVIQDHLGNTRLIYSDKNQNGKIESNSEIIQENHYYPFGLTMKGVWMGDENNLRYKYNGIEQNNNFGIELSFAHYRTLDPTIGRWMQVDPYANSFSNVSPYNSMLNRPINNVDPNGDFTAGFNFVAAAIGATVAGVGTYLATSNNENLSERDRWAIVAGATAVGFGAGGLIGGSDFSLSRGNVGKSPSKVNTSIGNPTNINLPLPSLSRPTPDSRRLPDLNTNVINNGTNVPTGDSYLVFNGTTLSLFSTHTNTNNPGAIFRTLVDSWPAVSGGANTAGIPPNINTTADNLRTRTTATMVRDGVGFSMDIPDQFDSHTQINRLRTLLRIHPDGASNGNWRVNNGSAGCIALQCNAADLNSFIGHMRNHLANHNNIRLHIVYNRVVPATAR